MYDKRTNNEYCAFQLGEISGLYPSVNPREHYRSWHYRYFPYCHKGQRVLILNRLVNRPLPIQGSEISFSWILCCNFSNDLDTHYGTIMFNCCNLQNTHILCCFWRITQKLGLKSILAYLYLYWCVSLACTVIGIT